MTIFVSYRREDSQSITGRIDDHLRTAFGREDVYRDVDSIPPGADFVDHLRDALEGCDVCIAIIGTGWVSDRLADENDFVRRELEAALNKRVPLIPVLVEGARLPKSDAVPDSLRALLRRQAVVVDSGGDFKVHVERLVESIKRVRNARAGAGAGARRLLWVLVGIGATALSALLLMRRASTAGENGETVTHVSTSIQPATVSKDSTAAGSGVSEVNGIVAVRAREQWRDDITTTAVPVRPRALLATPEMCASEEGAAQSEEQSADSFACVVDDHSQVPRGGVASTLSIASGRLRSSDPAKLRASEHARSRTDKRSADALRKIDKEHLSGQQQTSSSPSTDHAEPSDERNPTCDWRRSFSERVRQSRSKNPADSCRPKTTAELGGSLISLCKFANGLGYSFKDQQCSARSGVEWCWKVWQVAQPDNWADCKCDADVVALCGSPRLVGNL